MSYKTRWLMKKEYKALKKVIAYLADELKEYEAKKENGEPIRGHIGKSLNVLAAYEDEIDVSDQVLGMSLQSMVRRCKMENIPFEELPDDLTVSTRDPHKKRARPSLYAYHLMGNKKKRCAY